METVAGDTINLISGVTSTTEAGSPNNLNRAVLKKDEIATWKECQLEPSIVGLIGDRATTIFGMTNNTKEECFKTGQIPEKDSTNDEKLLLNSQRYATNSRKKIFLNDSPSLDPGANNKSNQIASETPSFLPTASLKIETPVTMAISPQTYLNHMLKNRSYPTKTHSALVTAGYHSRPTPLQTASYGTSLVKAARGRDASLVKKLLTCGLSPNSCNHFGESLLHMVCRRSDLATLKILLEHGASVQVSDDFGRTPLHDACWTSKPNFEAVDLILRRDSNLLRITDCRGSTPLGYSPKDTWRDWIEYFEFRKDEFWHPDDDKRSEKAMQENLEVMTENGIGTKELACLNLETARELSSGSLDPEVFLRERSGASGNYHDNGTTV